MPGSQILVGWLSNSLVLNDRRTQKDVFIDVVGVQLNDETSCDTKSKKFMMATKNFTFTSLNFEARLLLIQQFYLGIVSILS